MNNHASLLVVPCRSNLPDRQYDCVALYFSQAQRNALAERTTHFQRLREQDGSLFSLEFLAPELTPARVLIDDEDPNDPPEGVTRLDNYLEPFDDPDLQLTKLNVIPYLVVTQHGLFVSWEGRRERYGPNETYETYETATFSAQEVAQELHDA